MRSPPAVVTEAHLIPRLSNHAQSGRCRRRRDVEPAVARSALSVLDQGHEDVATIVAWFLVDVGVQRVTFEELVTVVESREFLSLWLMRRSHANAQERRAPFGVGFDWTR